MTGMMMMRNLPCSRVTNETSWNRTISVNQEDQGSAMRRIKVETSSTCRDAFTAEGLLS